jgi:hypothetical protein
MRPRVEILSRTDDMDMLLIGGLDASGSPCVTLDEERTQMAIWSISASPLIMGNDMRNVSAASKAILFNKEAIAVSQDPAGKMGIRISGDLPQQLWVRELSPSASGRSRVAVALYNKGGPLPTPPAPPMPPAGHCDDDWTHTTAGYYEACGGPAGDIGTFSNLTTSQARDECCKNLKCAGFSITSGSGAGSGYFKGNAACGVVKASGYDGYTKTSQIVPPSPPPPPPAPADIRLAFSSVPGCCGSGSVDVHDIWSGLSYPGLARDYVAKGVPYHGTAFLTLEWS